MQNFEKKLIFTTLAIVSPLFLQTSKVNAGGFGAEIFCTMRDGGNDHESSWEAAYTYIKKIKFDYIFIDGDHKYNSVNKDIYFAKKLLKLNKSYKGILCGDDLEIELSDYKKLKYLSKKDFEKSLFQNRNKDFIKENNISYHPGVTLSLAKTSKYNKVKTLNGIWYLI